MTESIDEEEKLKLQIVVVGQRRKASPSDIWSRSKKGIYNAYRR